MEPGTRPMLLETFAVTGGTPSASRVGNVISVPDPTTVLISPAAPPAASRASRSSQFTGGYSRAATGRFLLTRRGRGRRWGRLGRFTAAVGAGLDVPRLAV